jgi:ankyrin repeat protein
MLLPGKSFMIRTQSASILKGEAPQYVYAVVILSGGIAFIISQLAAPFTAWLCYALLAALFAFIWPNRALQWGGWLCLPIASLIFLDLIGTGSIDVLMRNGPIFIKALSFACLGAFVGSKLSVLKISHRFAIRQANRNRLDRKGKRAQKGLVLTKPAVRVPSVAPLLSSHSFSELAREIESPAHSGGLNAALIKAAQEGDLSRVELLFTSGADVNAKSQDRWSPLMFEPHDADVEMVKTLFGVGSKLNAPGDQGWTALMIATIEGHVEVVRSLLEHGAEVCAEKTKGWTALRFAVSMDETTILRMLLDAGADADSSDHEGKTALMQAAGENSLESLKALLDAGADPNIKDHKGQTALMIARTQEHTKIIELLKEAEAKARPAPHHYGFSRIS